MLVSALSAATLAATLLSPLPTTTADDPTIRWKPLVREHAGLSYILHVNETCDEPYPYVHQDAYRGSIPQHVTFTYTGAAARGDSDDATKIQGSIFNWFALPAPYIELDLKCTSDPGQALRAPQHIPGIS